MRVQGDYFSMDEERLDQLGDFTSATSDKVKSICVDYDWPNAKEHQAWLDTAPIDEIADWIDCIIDSEATYGGPDE